MSNWKRKQRDKQRKEAKLLKQALHSDPVIIAVQKGTANKTETETAIQQRKRIERENAARRHIDKALQLSLDPTQKKLRAIAKNMKALGIENMPKPDNLAQQAKTNVSYDGFNLERRAVPERKEGKHRYERPGKQTVKRFSKTK